MSTGPVAVNRPLTDDERAILLRLGARTLTNQMDCTTEAALEALDVFAARGLLRLTGDAYDAYLVVDGRPLTHTTRQFLAESAMALNEDGETPPIVRRCWPGECATCDAGREHG